MQTGLDSGKTAMRGDGPLETGGLRPAPTFSALEPRHLADLFSSAQGECSLETEGLPRGTAGFETLHLGSRVCSHRGEVSLEAGGVLEGIRFGWQLDSLGAGGRWLGARSATLAVASEQASRPCLGRRPSRTASPGSEQPSRCIAWTADWGRGSLLNTDSGEKAPTCFDVDRELAGFTGRAKAAEVAGLEY